MKPVHLTLPRLSPEQSAVLDDPSRFNLISGGIKSGKSTLADEVAALSPLGALRGHAVAYCVPKERIATIRRRLSARLSAALVGKPQRTKISLISGGIIHLVALDALDDFVDPVMMMVVDDASEAEDFAALWEGTLAHILPDIPLSRGQAWVFAKPCGAREGFGRLCVERANDDDWRVVCLPSHANPKADLVAIAHAEATLGADEFAQEYLGEVLLAPIELSLSQTIVGPEETFLDWCDRLAADGLMVDEMPFRLDNRPTMRFIYGLIPSTVEEAFRKRLILMKCSQVGFTVFEMLATIYLALKFMPCKIGLYLPSMPLAGIKSTERFMPVLRTIPGAYRLMLEDPSGTRKSGEGNVLLRNMGRSRFYFLWTSGATLTESVPLDVVSFDEVQEMSVGAMEKTAERMSASRIRYTLMGSTANWPDRDIHYWYQRGQQLQFWTRCPSCGEHQILDDHFPDCVQFIDGEYRYVCYACGGVIEDAQQGEWRAKNPLAEDVSLHYPQFLSPTISPGEMLIGYYNADDMKSFYNRKRGKPYLDPSQVPVNLAMLNECARIGMETGVIWKARATGALMGIDQMGLFNVVLIAERLPTGHMAIIHAEEIYSDDPFARCSELMARYGVAVCVVESLPNYNDAKRFAGRHLGRVFLASYADRADDMMLWGDAVPSKAERKTHEEERDRYTVSLDQYKSMQVAMGRIQARACLFPDPEGLVQEIREKERRLMVPLLKDRVFVHFLHTALISGRVDKAGKDDDTRSYRRRVVKVGMDPHFSFAFMLLNAAWARSFGTSMFLNPMDVEVITSDLAQAMPGLPAGVAGMVEGTRMETCGGCEFQSAGRCSERDVLVRANDVACEFYLPTGPA